MLQPSELKPWELYKFVKVNGEIRFIDQLSHHSELLKPGEVATSAGTIGIKADCWELHDGYSISLKVSCDQTSEAEISALLGLRQRNKWE